MQIGGLGSSHSTSDHHVTNCIHDHHDVQKQAGGAAMKASAAMEASAAKTELQQEGLFSLSAWLKNMLGGGKGFLLNFWGQGQATAGSMEGNQAAVSGKGEGQAVISGTEGSQAETVAHAGDPNIAAAVQPAIQPRVTHNPPYFSGAGDAETRKQTFLRKIRERFQNVSGRMSGRRFRKKSDFQTRNSFQARQEKPREDLRRHGRYRKDTVEINYARTEESYLMDSYDRKGEYSLLTTKK